MRRYARMLHKRALASGVDLLNRNREHRVAMTDELSWRPR
jgi:hypothetical protein